MSLIGRRRPANTDQADTQGRTTRESGSATWNAGEPRAPSAEVREI
jgi:hypothetical protein